jgi:hypothetical protein
VVAARLLGGAFFRHVLSRFAVARWVCAPVSAFRSAPA